MLNFKNMNKNILKWIMPFILCVLICSCYEDKGNYEYDDDLEITLDSINFPDKVYTILDTVQIEPVVFPIERKYTYWWGISVKNLIGAPPKLDTLCHTKNLNWIVNLKPEEYTVVFCATDTETGISKYFDKNFKVHSEFTTGTYLCKEINGETDYDLYSAKGDVNNLIKGIYNSSFKGEATDAYFLKMWQPDSTFPGGFKQVPSILTSTIDGLYLTKLDDVSLLKDFDNFFYETPTTRNVSTLILVSGYGSYSAAYVCIDGLLYGQDLMSRGSGEFGAPKVTPHKLSNVYANTTFAEPFLFNELDHSLCFANRISGYLNYFDDKNTKGLTQGIKKMIMIGNDWADNALLVIPNKVEEEESVGILKSNSAHPSIAIKFERIEISSDKKIFDMEEAVGMSQVVYFSEGNQIYSSSVNNDFAEQLLISLPAGYKVSNMYPNPHGGGAKFLHISAYLGDDYFVYKYKVQAGKLIPIDEVDKKQKNPVYTGKGKVKKMIVI